MKTPYVENHLHGDEAPPAAGQLAPELDFDLVEASFVEGFAAATDPTSFLRLAGVPLVGADSAGRRLRLLRVELARTTDVGAVMPRLGGAGYRYDPLPVSLVSKRQHLRFVYHDGEVRRELSCGDARALRTVDGPS